MTNTHTMDGYFQEYRKKLELLNSFNKEHDKIRAESMQIFSKIEKVRNEINDMRRVITLIVEKGLDPVEARLVLDESDNNNLWSCEKTVGSIFDMPDIDYTTIPTVDISYELNNDGYHINKSSE